MVNDPSLSDSETLGQFLHRHRTEKGFDLAEVAEETKIPPATLQAMEDGDYKALPADAFARGFYAIYARLLDLDVDHVMDQYTKERGASQKNTKKALQTPSKLGEAVSPMAERPMISPVSIMGFALVILVLVVTGICWYFSWNPAKFLSEQLRSIGSKPAIEQPKENTAVGHAPTSINKTMSPPSDETAAKNMQNTALNGKYTLLAEFQEDTKVTVVVDEEFPEELNFSTGQRHEWHPKESMTLTLPAGTKTRLSLNGVIIPLPAPVDGFVTVSIPGSLAK
jgi:cytoskeletal protein RodZ